MSGAIRDATPRSRFRLENEIGNRFFYVLDVNPLPASFRDFDLFKLGVRCVPPEPDGRASGLAVFRNDRLPL